MRHQMACIAVNKYVVHVEADWRCWAQMFLRAGQMAVLDKMRTELMHSSAVIVQRHLRGWLARQQYARVRWAVFTIQVHPDFQSLSPIACSVEQWA